MAQRHPTLAVAAAKMPKERVAQLDRLARRRAVSRSRLIRDALEALLDAGDEPLTSAEEEALAERCASVAAVRRLAEIRRKYRAA